LYQLSYPSWCGLKTKMQNYPSEAFKQYVITPLKA